MRRGPPLHDVKDIAMVLLSSGATHARRAVTPMPLAALAAPDGTWSAYTPRHAVEERDVLTLAFASPLEPERRTYMGAQGIGLPVHL